MEKKYLPIGTVCTIKGENKRVMITGFYSVKYNGNIKINDYVGCYYPEGMLIPEGVVSFNHNDILNVDYMGFKNEENSKFQSLLNKITGNVDEEIVEEETVTVDDNQAVAPTGIFSKIVFDENGVVTFVEPAIKSAEPQEETPFSNIQFDENGYVVRADNDTVDNPFYKEYKVDEKPKEIPQSKWKIFDNKENNIQSTTPAKTISDELVSVKFDDDGDVLEELDKTKELPKLDNIVFDDNGVIIEANGVKIGSI